MLKTLLETSILAFLKFIVLYLFSLMMLQKIKLKCSFFSFLIFASKAGWTVGLTFKYMRRTNALAYFCSTISEEI